MIMASTVFIQAIGLLAMGFDLCATFIKDDRKMIKLNALGSLTFAIHYAMLGAHAGALSEALNATRTSLSLKWKSKYIGLLFVRFYVFLLIVHSRSLIEACPYLCGIIITLGLYFLTGIKLRLCYLIGYSLWLLYSIAAFSIGGIILFSITLITLSLTIFRLSKDPQNHLLEP
jgi:hypothetical protein